MERKVKILMDYTHPDSGHEELALELVEVPESVIIGTERDVSGLKMLILDYDNYDVVEEATTITSFVIDMVESTRRGYERASTEHKEAYRYKGKICLEDIQIIASMQIIKELVKAFGAEGWYWPQG